MKNFLIKGLAVLFSILFLNSWTAGAGEPKVLRIIENDWPPYYFKEKSGPLPGFARELLDHCLPRLGFETEFVFYPVKRMYTYLAKGEIDIALFSYRKSREDLVHYSSEPLFVSGYRPVVRAGTNIRIQSLSDFDSLTIGHLAGLKYSKDFLSYIEKRRGAGTLVTSITGDSCLRMLTEGMIDVFVDIENTVRWRAKQMGFTDQIEILSYDIRTRDYFVTLSKTSPRIVDKIDFLKKMDECLRTMKTDGRYREIAAKYGL
ncbi:substrate-binding periplasmic protein [Desulfospira joergensenii]|uniref:substrate-binding periplasmic protein n=1 Tax=Desulfospira joergensenii TaxID=53329 RepID=UPI0003B67ABC|nr:transporter substrate-binding domain-containing protein [Desulfospira joergensenii]